MTDYDGKTFKELLGMLTDQVANLLLLGQPPIDPEGLQSALRSAVIREASVGEVTVEIRESEDELTLPVGDPNRIVTCSERFVCPAWIPEGTYCLVPKEIK